MMKSKLKNRGMRSVMTLVVGVVAMFSLVACGSSSGGSAALSSTTPKSTVPASALLSGVAATGAPIEIGHVYLKDSVGNNIDREAITDNNGLYNIDVTGLTPPFFIKIEWNDPITDEPMVLFSATNDASGNANINEITSAAVQVAIAQAGGGAVDPKDVFDNCSAYSMAIAGNLDTAIESIIQFLTPVLENPKFNAEGINPLKDYFAANGLALDKVLHEGELEIKNGELTFTLNGQLLGALKIDDLDNPDCKNCDRISSNEVATALSGVHGIGQICPFPASLNLNVPAGGGGTLSHDVEDTFFQSTSINAPTMSGGTATITGTGILNGDSGHTFTATIKDGLIDRMGFEIDGDAYPVPGSGPLAVISGNWIISESGNISGIGQTCPFPATLNLNVSDGGEGSLVYDWADTFFQATSINLPSFLNGTATITGLGMLNGETGHTFTAIVKDGTLDKMGFEIDGVPHPVPVSGPLFLINNTDFSVQQ